MLILFDGPVQIEGKWYREILFIEEKQEKKEMWTGTMMDEEEAKEVSGIAAVMPNTAFKTLDIDWEPINRILANRSLFIERDNKTHPGDLASMV